MLDDVGAMGSMPHPGMQVWRGAMLNTWCTDVICDISSRLNVWLWQAARRGEHTTWCR
jgi:hypothetical protein